jgi:hypothetical protein
MSEYEIEGKNALITGGDSDKKKASSPPIRLIAIYIQVPRLAKTP